MPCYSPLKGWVDPHTGGICFDRSANTEKMEVACGQCLGCRCDRTRHWALRIAYESSLHDDSCFVTLTYRDKDLCTKAQLDEKLHVPDCWSLRHDHVQKFLKRLRKRISPRKVRFYMCGEYGARCIHNLDVDVYPHDTCKVGRPHYHLCLFGFTPPVGDFVTDNVRESPWLDEVWKYGFTSVGELNFESAAYVSRYCLKKVTGQKADDHYMRIDTETGERIWLEHEYSRMSNRPGIAKNWFDKYKEDILDGQMPLPGGGVAYGTPRYFDKKLEEEMPDVYAIIKEDRQKYLAENKEEFTPQRLWSKYKVKKAELELFTKRDEL
jgi:hypothetical protein